MIRVVLPAHLRTLARVDGEVKLDLEGRPPSARSSTPSRPPIRCCAERSAITSPSSAGRSSGFFACEEDLTHEPPDAPLPDAVALGAEPFLIVGAMAGG